MTAQLLPSEFADLERFAVKWCRPTEDERWNVRMTSRFDEVRDFYETTFPRAEAAISYLDQFTLDALDQHSKNLVYLLCSLNTASFPMECWGQVKVPDTGAAKVDCVLQQTL